MLLNGLHSRLKKQEEQVNELENKSIENNTIEEHRKKKRLKKLTEPQQLVGHFHSIRYLPFWPQKEKR